MKLFRISFELKSSLVTELKGDTIWGHFVWGMANHEGDETVKGFLNQSKSDEPPLIVSSAFPTGTLCIPLPEPQKRLKSMSKADYSKIKKNKKNKFIKADEYIENATECTGLVKAFTESSVLHNSINRMTNTVEDGQLYSVRELWAKNNPAVFDLYILSTYEKNRIVELTNWAFENGYGADSSTGHGAISVLNDSIQEIKLKKSGNKYVALAPFIDEKHEISNLRSDIYIRTGKIGGSFSGYVSPFKKTVILYDEGAVFESEKPIKYIGNLITDVHSDSRICQSGFAPVIPI